MTLRAARNRFGLSKNPKQVIRHKPLGAVHCHMIIVTRIEQVSRQFRPEATFIAFKDHLPSACISSERMDSTYA